MWRGDVAVHDRGGDPAGDRAAVGGGGVPGGVARRRASRRRPLRRRRNSSRWATRSALLVVARRGAPGVDGRGVLLGVGSLGGPSGPQERPAPRLAGAESGLGAIAGGGR